MPPQNRVAPPRQSNKPLLVALLVIVALAAFAVEEWALAPRGASSRLAASAGRATQDPAAGDPTAAPGRGAWTTPRQPVPSAPATAPRAGAPDPVSRVSRARVEAQTKLESLRSYIDESCWTRGSGAAGVKVTFNVTFDAAGREIARGISEDRRAPAGEFGRCLRRLRGAALTIAPPGANVGVSIPVSFP